MACNVTKRLCYRHNMAPTTTSILCWVCDDCWFLGIGKALEAQSMLVCVCMCLCVSVCVCVRPHFLANSCILWFSQVRTQSVMHGVCVSANCCCLLWFCLSCRFVCVHLIHWLTPTSCFYCFVSVCVGKRVLSIASSVFVFVLVCLIHPLVILLVVIVVFIVLCLFVRGNVP